MSATLAALTAAVSLSLATAMPVGTFAPPSRTVAPAGRPIPAGGDAIGTPPVFIPPAVRQRSDPTGGTATGVGAGTTAAIVGTLNQATLFCRAFPQGEYVIDCLAERLDDVSRRMAGTSGYDEVRAALDETARGLHRIARDNRSAALPPARFTGAMPGGSRITTSRPLVAVDPARMAAALAQAVAVIGEAETMLLRSAEGSGDRAAQFRRIADAVGSNKVLLRSL